MSLRIHTSRYHYNGPDRLDITGKSKDPYGQIAEPTWEMIWGWKKYGWTWSRYKRAYRELLKQSEKDHSEEWNDVISREHVVLVCFCPAFGNCHRYEFTKWLVHRYDAIYEGEILIRKPWGVII
jgi:uncharacterized protein YeaO (DUF488 family)